MAKIGIVVIREDDKQQAARKQERKHKVVSPKLLPHIPQQAVSQKDHYKPPTHHAPFGLDASFDLDASFKKFANDHCWRLETVYPARKSKCGTLKPQNGR